MQVGYGILPVVVAMVALGRARRRGWDTFMISVMELKRSGTRCKGVGGDGKYVEICLQAHCMRIRGFLEMACERCSPRQ